MPSAQLLSSTSSQIPSLGLLLCHTLCKWTLRWDLRAGDLWLTFPLLGWCMTLIFQDFSRNLKVTCVPCAEWCPSGSTMEGVHGHLKAAVTQEVVSPLLQVIQIHPTSSSPLKFYTQLERDRARQHTVCYKTCTRTSVPLRGLSNEENKWCFEACNCYIHMNNFTSSCVQVSGCLAQCISTNRFTPSLPAIASSQQMIFKGPNLSQGTLGKFSFLFLPCYCLLCHPEFHSFLHCSGQDEGQEKMWS